MGRAPCFEFASLSEAGRFAEWLGTQLEALREAVAGTSRYCRLVNSNAAIVGNTVYTLFNFSTGDAAGQNMVTLATQAICQKILSRHPRGASLLARRIHALGRQTRHGPAVSGGSRA